MSTATVGLLSSAAKVTATRTTASINASSSSTSCCCGAPFIAAVSLSSYKFTAILTTSRKLRLTCEVTSDSKTSSSSSVLSPSSDDDDDDESAVSKIGAKIKVKVPLKVYHVPKVPELDLTGMVGELKQYAGLWKGKRISANLPFKVEFVIDVQGRGSLKFCAHLKRDEFDYLSD